MDMLSTPSPAATPSRDAAADAHTAGVSKLDLGDLVRILNERRYIILSAIGVGLVLAILASLLMTPLFRATALIELNPPSGEVLNQASGNKASGSSNAAEMMATQTGLLKSDSLARRVAQNLNLVSRPEFGGEGGTRSERLDRAAALIQNNSLVEGQRGSMLIEVNYSSPDPALAARIANALVDGFITGNLERRYDSSSYARDFLKDQLAATKDALEKSERQLNAYAINSGIFRAPSQISNGVVTEGASLATTDLQATNDALNQARVRRITTEQAYRTGGSENSSTVNSAVAQLRQQRATLQAEYNDKRELFQDGYPELQQLKQRIATLDRAITDERSGTTNGRRTDLRSDFDAARLAEQTLQSKLGQLKDKVQDERGRSIQYNILQREVETNRELHDALLQRYKEIGVAGGIGQSNVSLVDRAEVPLGPYRPNLWLNLAIGLLGGSMLGVLLAVAAHLLLDNIVSPNDVRAKLGLPVLGVIPLESGQRTPSEALGDRKSDLSEAYFSVRTALRFSDVAGAPHSLLITSSHPGEGKSTSALAIATSFARTGSRVLLIDADLRKPTFVSRQSGSRGLAWLLASEEPIKKYIEPSATENLELLPVGRYSGSAAELLASNRLSMIIQEAKQQYDMVVCDGPPVLGLADAPLLGALMEKTVIVVESRKARTARVTEMVRRLQASGTVLAGVVLTKVRSNAGGYNYYSYAYGSEGEGGHVTTDLGRALDVNA